MVAPGPQRQTNGHRFSGARVVRTENTAVARSPVWTQTGVNVQTIFGVTGRRDGYVAGVPGRHSSHPLQREEGICATSF